VGVVDRIVVGLGPGSYAGVRITIAAALGLQAVWGCELVGIPSVAALPEGSGCFQVIGDARRGTWYYTRVEAGVCVEGPLLVDSGGALRTYLEKAERWEVYATEELPPEWGASVLLPSASILANLAAAGTGIVQTADLEPLYLRDVHITRPAAARG
jgi:tRNA threonylcarbamoyl adenosine modification protein YeaZ